jgi:hypothetical protein
MLKRVLIGKGWLTTLKHVIEWLWLLLPNSLMLSRRINPSNSSMTVQVILKWVF